MKRAAATLASLIVFAGCESDSVESVPARPPSTVAFEDADAILYVDVADQVGEQERGMMGVDRLPVNEGMAFVYDEPVRFTFWMKDTLIPLSVAFVDEEGRVIGVRDMEPCEADPCPSYGVDEPYVLAIEANSGWFQEHGVDVGDRAELTVMAYQ